jgi:uncharacterized membrane protein
MNEQGENTKRRTTSRTRQLASISAFSALSVVGSFIHLPGPVSTVAFDSAPGFFVALYFGPLEGAAVSGIGHMATSIVNGFPLGVLHLPIALGLAIAGGVMGFLNRKIGYVPALIVGVAINIGLVVLAVPAMGWAATISFIPFLGLAACLNAVIAALAYVGVRNKLRF